jgi:hypothetical protein
MKIATGLARRKKGKKETKIMGPIANYGFSKIKDLTKNRKVIIRLLLCQG